MVTKKVAPFKTILSPHERIYTPSGTKEEDVWEMIVDEKGRETFAVTGKVNVYEKTQAFADSVDLGKIIEKVTLTGDYNILNQRKTEYLDITEMPDNIIEAHSQLENAKRTFEKMPLEIRNKYDHDFSKYLEDMGSKEWVEIMEKYNNPEETKIEEPETETKGGEE